MKRLRTIVLLIGLAVTHAQADIAVDELFVRGYELEGTALLTSDEVDTLTQPYVGRDVTFEELLALRQLLTEARHGSENRSHILGDLKHRHIALILLRIAQGFELMQEFPVLVGYLHDARRAVRT